MDKIAQELKEIMVKYGKTLVKPIWVVSYDSSPIFISEDRTLAEKVCALHKKLYSALPVEVRSIAEAMSHAYSCGCDDNFSEDMD